MPSEFIVTPSCFNAANQTAYLRSASIAPKKLSMGLVRTLPLAALTASLLPAAAQGPAIEVHASSDQFGLTLRDALTDEDTGCHTVAIGGASGSSSLDLTISLPPTPSAVIRAALTGPDGPRVPSLGQLLLPTPNVRCNTHLVNVSGQISIYSVWAASNVSLEGELSGGVNYTDLLEVYSPTATTIELPLHVSADLAAAQTFCEPSGSEAVAKAELTGSLAGATLTVGDEARISGAFLDHRRPGATRTLSVEVPAGVSTFPLTLSGSLSVRSKALGVSPLGVIACGSTAVATAGNSITVEHFTGPGGAPLPQGLTITGLTTGVNYSSPGQPIACVGAPQPAIDVTPANCGAADGTAALVGEGVDTLEVTWSTGATGLTEEGLAPGDYYVVAGDGAGCSRLVRFAIVDPTAPVVRLPRDTVIDEGATVSLDAGDATRPGLTYRWDGGQTSAAITVDSPGTYRVTVTDTAAACDYVYEVEVVSSREYRISGGDLATDFGFFYDDGGPEGDYADDESYVVAVCPQTAGRFAVLRFDEVAVDGRDDQDELSIFDGVGSTCVLSAGVTAPETFVASASSGGCLSVRFRSTSGSGVGAGWAATISTTDAPPPGCFEDVVGCGARFTDDSGVDGDYPPGQFRVYRLCPSADAGPETYVSLDFEEVELGAGDALSVYDGAGVACLLERSVAAGAGFTASAISGGCLTVVLDAAEGSAGPGWLAGVRCVDEPTAPRPSCACGANPEPANVCAEAPLLNNLEAFCGLSSIQYTADAPGNLEQQFSCGIVHNNSFLRFIPDAETVAIGYQTAGGTESLCGGFQLAVLAVEGACDAPDAQWRNLGCTNINDGLASRGTFDVGGLTPGETYYLMIDGSFGSECYFSLEAVDGFATCPLDLDYARTECLGDGTYYVRVPLAIEADSATYRVYERQNYFAEFDTLSLTSYGPSDTIVYGPYPVGRGYDIVVDGGGVGPGSCALSVRGESPCEVPCDGLAIALSAGCPPGSARYAIGGRLVGGAPPYSIVGADTSTVLFPDAGTEFSFGPFVPAVARPYGVTVTDANGCAALDTVYLAPDSFPSLDLGPDLTITDGDTVSIGGLAEAGLTYSWSTGDTTAALLADAAGEYELTVRTPSGCEVSQAVTVTVEPVDDFVVLPNPGRGRLTIRRPSGTTSPYQLEVYDAAGRLVLSRVGARSRASFPTGDLASGSYYLRLELDGEVSIRTWIKS